MPTLLDVTGIETVGFVDAGANPIAEVLLFKRDGIDSPEPEPKKDEGGKLRRMVAAVGKALGLSDEQLKKAYDEAATYSEIQDERQLDRITGEVWQLFSDLGDSVSRTLRDDDEANPEGVIRTSVAEATAAFEAALPTWLSGETVEKAGRKISAARLGRLKQAAKTLAAIIEEAEPAPKQTEKKMADFDKTTLEGEALEAFEALEKRAEEAEESVTTLEERVEKLEAGDGGEGGGEGGENDVLKNADPELQAAFEKARAETDAAKKAADEALEKAQAATDELEMERLQKRAGSDFDQIEGTPADKAKILKSIQALPEDERDALEGVLKSSNERIRQGGLFKTMGGDGVPDGDSATAKIQAAAAEVAKAEGISKSEAVEKVMKDNPELRAAYAADRQ